MTRHRRTDPACYEYHPSRSRIAKWWFDRNRGRACMACANRGWRKK